MAQSLISEWNECSAGIQYRVISLSPVSCRFISSWAWTDDERHTAIWITLLCLHRWNSSICCIQLKIILPSEVVIMSESHSSDYFWMLAMCYKLSISFLACKMWNIQRMLQTGHKTDNMENVSAVRICALLY